MSNMKKLLLSTIILIGFLANSFAQNGRPLWATIKTPNLRCWECKKRLEDYMAREIAQTESGIMKMQINLLSGTTRVQYRPDRVSLNYIQTAFANAGFDADDIKAEEDSYKKLPPACKRVEEGGGPKKGKPCHMQPF
jgi:periplasmic mercuric ion binding protein